MLDTHAVRMLEKIALPENPDDCWEWTGTVNNGYPKCYVEKNHQVYAQRAMYELCNMKPVRGGHLKRTCDNPLCMNPAHLLTTGER